MAHHGDQISLHSSDGILDDELALKKEPLHAALRVITILQSILISIVHPSDFQGTNPETSTTICLWSPGNTVCTSLPDIGHA